MTILEKRIKIIIIENVDEVEKLMKKKRKISWYKFKEKRLVQSKIDSRKGVIKNLIKVHNTL